MFVLAVSLRTLKQKCSLQRKRYNPGQKQLGHLRWITWPPFLLATSVLENVVFFDKKEKKLHDYHYCKWWRGEFASCPNVFVWDCRSLSYYHLCTIISRQYKNQVKIITINSLPFNQLEFSIQRERNKGRNPFFFLFTSLCVCYIGELHSLIAIKWVILAQTQSICVYHWSFRQRCFWGKPVTCSYFWKL